MGLRGPGAKAKKPKATDLELEDLFPSEPAWKAEGLSRAGRVIAFIEGLKITSGMHAGKNFILRDWQKAQIYKIYGTDEEGKRIVRTALLTIARKNGKTALIAALALCHLCGPEAEQRGQVYSAAADRNQAALIFRELEAFILADPWLEARCNVQRFAKRIEDMETGSFYEALSSDARKAHGLSPSFIVCDELAQWPANSELYNNLTTGIGARAEPLVFVISTQSANPKHIMSELVDYGIAVNSGEIVDPKFAAFIYTVPHDADPWDESLWHLANPALGDFRSLQEMRDTAEQAKRIPSKEGPFRNLYLNQRIEPDERFIGREDWEAGKGAVDLVELEGQPCWLGLDLSSTTDLTACAAWFPVQKALLVWFWLPADALLDREHRDRVPYTVWREQGYLETTPGKVIDKRAVALRLAELTSKYDVLGCAYDRWRMADLQKILDDEGITLPMQDHGQGFKDMSPALEAFEVEVLSHQMRHGGNPVLTWNVSNAKVVSDPAGARKVAKDRSIARVDGLVAGIMAVGLCARLAEPADAELDVLFF